MLSRPQHPNQIHSKFAPGFAHQVFGDAEIIEGYKDLSIDFLYSSGSLFVYFNVKFSEKRSFPPPAPLDLLKTLLYWMPEETVLPMEKWGTQSMDAFRNHLETVNSKWTPPGQCISTYSLSETHDDIYEVWHGKFSDPAVREYHQRMRPFVIWYVDGSRYLDDTDETWDIFM